MLIAHSHGKTFRFLQASIGRMNVMMQLWLFFMTLTHKMQKDININIEFTQDIVLEDQV